MRYNIENAHWIGMNEFEVGREFSANFSIKWMEMRFEIVHLYTHLRVYARRKLNMVDWYNRN